MKIYSGGLTIDIAFSDKKYEKYFKIFGLPPDGKPDLLTVKKIFMMIVRDFIKGDVLLDEMAYMCGVLNSCVVLPGNYDKVLTSILDTAYELSFYVRRAFDSGCASSFVSNLTEVLDYYESQKPLIDLPDK